MPITAPFGAIGVGWNTESLGGFGGAPPALGWSDPNSLNPAQQIGLANRQNQTQRYGYDQQLRQAQEAAGASRYGADQGLAGVRYGSDQQLAGLRYSTDAQMQRQLAAQAFAQQRLQQAMSMFGSLAGDGGGGALGGAPGGPGPAVTQGGVYSPAQVQGQVNSQVAASDAQSAGAYRRALAEQAGRGLGTASPLAAALRARYDAQAGMQSAQVRQDVPWQAAQANADAALHQQALAEQQYAARQSEAIQRSGVAMQGRNALLAALAGIATSGV